MSRAFTLAKEAKRQGNHPFGAVVVYKGDVISTGYSSEITDSDVAAHAETKALQEATKQVGRDLKDCSLFASGEPCNMCVSAIFHAHVGRIVIGCSREDIPSFFCRHSIGISELAADSSYKPDIVWGVIKEKAIELFQNIIL